MRSKIIRFTSTLLVLSIFLTSCYGEMSGTVIDAETGKHIEGAVILVEWTYTSGKWIGLRTTSSYKVVEVITDKEGKFKVSGVLNPLIDSPRVTIYKKGYVAWNNEYIFPDYKRREDFKLTNGISIKLKLFDEQKYTYNDHIMFIHGSINYGLPGSDKKIIERAIRWEQLKAIEERQKIK